jgi:hypothetical protein
MPPEKPKSYYAEHDFMLLVVFPLGIIAVGVISLFT